MNFYKHFCTLLVLSFSAMAMDIAKEKEDQDVPPLKFGTLTFNHEEKRFEGDIVEKIAHIAGEFGDSYYRKGLALNQKLKRFEKKISTVPDIVSENEDNPKDLLTNKLSLAKMYYDSKGAWLKKKQQAYLKKKEIFNALPVIFNRVLLDILRDPYHFLYICVDDEPIITLDITTLDKDVDFSCIDLNFGNLVAKDEGLRLIYHPTDHTHLIYNDVPQHQKPSHPHYNTLQLDHRFTSETNRNGWLKFLTILQNAVGRANNFESLLIPGQKTLYDHVKMGKKAAKLLGVENIGKREGKYELIANFYQHEEEVLNRKVSELAQLYKEILKEIMAFQSDVRGFYEKAIVSSGS